MAGNIFWNLVFLFDFGGIIALVLYALARWPKLVKQLDTLIFLGAFLLLLVLLAGAIVAHAFSPRRGVYIHGMHYEDIWRDD
jgi:hypothetical protein